MTTITNDHRLAVRTTAVCAGALLTLGASSAHAIPDPVHTPGVVDRSTGDS